MSRRFGSENTHPRLKHLAGYVRHLQVTCMQRVWRYQRHQIRLGAGFSLNKLALCHPGAAQLQDHLAGQDTMAVRLAVWQNIRGDGRHHAPDVGNWPTPVRRSAGSGCRLHNKFWWEACHHASFYPLALANCEGFTRSQSQSYAGYLCTGKLTLKAVLNVAACCAGEPVYSNNYSLTAGKRGAPSLLM